MFTIFVSVDGNWAGWLQWSGCSVTYSRSLFQLTVNWAGWLQWSGSSVTCSRSLFQLTVNGPDGCSGLVVV